MLVQPIQKPLHAAAVCEIDHRVAIRREDIADADHVRPAKHHDAVAVGVRGRHVIHQHGFAIEQEILGRPEIRVIDAGGVRHARLSQLHQAIQDVLMRDHARPLARVRRSAQPDQGFVSADVIRIQAGVDHPNDRPVGELADGRHHFRRGRRGLGIHHHESFFPDLDGGVAAGPHQHGDVALHRKQVNFLGPGTARQNDRCGCTVSSCSSQIGSRTAWCKCNSGRTWPELCNPFSFSRYSGYSVSAPPRVASYGNPYHSETSCK